jgi:hypothetical protein
MTRQLYHPCLDIFMRALPFTFRHVEALPGTIVAVIVTGDAGGEWFAARRSDSWSQVLAPDRSADAVVTMDQDNAWKLVTKRRPRDVVKRAFPNIRIEGNTSLGENVLDLVSVMA